MNLSTLQRFRKGDAGGARASPEFGGSEKRTEREICKNLK